MKNLIILMLTLLSPNLFATTSTYFQTDSYDCYIYTIQLNTIECEHHMFCTDSDDTSYYMDGEFACDSEIELITATWR